MQNRQSAPTAAKARKRTANGRESTPRRKAIQPPIHANGREGPEANREWTRIHAKANDIRQTANIRESPPIEGNTREPPPTAPKARKRTANGRESTPRRKAIQPPIHAN